MRMDIRKRRTPQALSMLLYMKRADRIFDNPKGFAPKPPSNSHRDNRNLSLRPSTSIIIIIISIAIAIPLSNTHHFALGGLPHWAFRGDCLKPPPRRKHSQSACPSRPHVQTPSPPWPLSATAWCQRHPQKTSTEWSPPSRKCTAGTW